MDNNTFQRSVEKGAIKSVYIFMGPEEMTKREALAFLRQSLLPPGLEALNDATLENYTARDIIEVCEVLPVMCERRMVEVRNWIPFCNAKSKSDKEEAARMLEWMENAPETCTLVFYMNSEVDSKKINNQLQKLPGWVTFNRLEGKALQDWCNRHLQPFGKHIDRGSSDLLSSMTGQDLTRISMELDKLAAYVEPQTEIGPEAIHAMVTPTLDFLVFRILDYLLSGDLQKAMAEAKLALRSDNNPVRLIALFSSQLRVDTHIKFAMESRGQTQDVIRALGINPYRAKMVQKQVQNIPAQALLERYLACVETDYAIKSGNLRDRAGLDLLMLKILWPNNGTKAS